MSRFVWFAKLITLLPDGAKQTTHTSSAITYRPRHGTNIRSLFRSELNSDCPQSPILVYCDIWCNNTGNICASMCDNEISIDIHSNQLLSDYTNEETHMPYFNSRIITALNKHQYPTAVYLFCRPFYNEFMLRTCN